MDLFDSIHTPEEDRAAELAMTIHRDQKHELRKQVAEVADRRKYQAMLDSVADWRPPELPVLDGIDHVIIDCESTGLRWWNGDRMIGIGLWTPDKKTRYLPIRHKVGANIPEDTFFEWVRRELRGKKITNIRTKFDLHLFRVDGIDLEEQGCTFGDVAHQAALLDDHRRAFNQEDLVRDFLKIDTGKLTSTHGYDLDPGKFQQYPAGLIAERAESDVLMVSLLAQAFGGMIRSQGLERVLAVEEAIIPAVVEMEHNGAPIDVEKLERWVYQSERDLKDALHEIFKATGVQMRTPDNREDQHRVFHALGLAVPTDAFTGAPSFADDLLAVYEHPTIYQLRRAKALASLRSKFLLKYWESCKTSGILRYELHQLPYEDDKGSSGGGGAVSGRFSSAAMTYYDENGTQKKDGGNIQQVMGVKSQYDKKKPDDFWPTKDYIIRSLIIPDRKANPGAGWFGSDMRQIEYRRFVHYSEDPQLIESYISDPLTDYHQLVHGLIVKHTGKDFERTHVKNLNFASLYGAGLIKIAFMVKEIDQKVYMELRAAMERTRRMDRATAAKERERIKSDPRIAKTRSLYDTYHTMFPAVKKLLDLASDTAAERGYVMTILGRRARFHKGDRMYSALNRVIQGTAADDNKVTLIDVHKNRKRLGFIPRFTVHDELGGDLLDPSSLPVMADFLNQQRLESRVPILWDSKVAANWAETK